MTLKYILHNDLEGGALIQQVCFEVSFEDISCSVLLLV